MQLKLESKQMKKWQSVFGLFVTTHQENFYKNKTFKFKLSNKGLIDKWDHYVQGNSLFPLLFPGSSQITVEIYEVT